MPLRSCWLFLPPSRRPGCGAWVIVSVRLVRGGPNEHDWHITQLHELAGDAAEKRAHRSTASVGGHDHQRGVVLGHGFLDAVGCFADANIRFDRQCGMLRGYTRE